MWELNHKEGWELQNWCFQIVVLEKTLESPLDSKEIGSVNPKGNHPWIFIGRTIAEAAVPTHRKTPWCWERLKAKGEGSSRGGDGYTASPTQWTWIWENSGRQWRTCSVHEVTESLTWFSDQTTTTINVWQINTQTNKTQEKDALKI